MKITKTLGKTLIIVFVLINLIMGKEVHSSPSVDSDANISEKQLDITYTLSFSEAQAHYVDVLMEIKGLDQAVTDIKLPVWTPGSYLIREFPKGIESFDVTSGSKEVASKKVRKNVWRVETEGQSSIAIAYKVYAFELSVRTSYIEQDKAYLNGTSIFMYVDGHLQEEVIVNVKPDAAWKEISTSMPAVGGNKWSRSAPNYDVLVDSPILIGNQEIFEFTAEGIPHYLALDGDHNMDVERAMADFKKVIKVETELFGENPCKDYTTIVLNTPNSYGGLEHLSSTSLIYPQWKYNQPDGYMRFISLFAHEYFHLWNVKRIRPAALGPFDYENENYTHLLWVMEGFTSYYDEYLLQRCGFIETPKYLTMLAKNFNYCENTPGSDVQSLTESSFDTWIKLYRRNENTVNCCVTYYTKGAAVTSLLDLEIRHRTNGEKSLDDVLRYLYQEYYKKQDRGFTSEELQAAVEMAAGGSLNDFFLDYVWGTEHLDYNQYLGYVGLEVKDNYANNNIPYLGVRPKDEDGKVMVKEIIRYSPAWEAGISAGDEIIAVNGFRIHDSFSDWLKRFQVGDDITLTVSRSGKLRTIETKLSRNPESRLEIVKKANATDAEKALYKSWLGEAF